MRIPWIGRFGSPSDLFEQSLPRPVFALLSFAGPNGNVRSRYVATPLVRANGGLCVTDPKLDDFSEFRTMLTYGDA